MTSVGAAQRVGDGHLGGDEDADRLVGAANESRQRYSSTLDHILEGCQIIAFDWRYLYLNAAAETHNRRPNTELIGKRMVDVWPGIEQSHVFGVLRRCMEDRAPSNEETEFHFPDGRTGWYEVRVHPVPEGIFVLSMDISERKRAEHALRQSEANFRMLLEAMPQLVWSTGADGHDTFFNQRWVEYTGLHAAEGEADGWMRPVHPDDLPRAAAAWRGANDFGTAFALEARLRGYDGQYRYWLVQGLPFRDAAGLIVKWFGIATNVHELMEAETRLRRTEEQLRQSQKLEAIGRLAGGVAHDFNNLLSVILSYTSLVLSELPGDAHRADLEEVHKAGERAAELTRQLLAFGRQQVLSPKVIELGQIIHGVENMLQRLLGEDVKLSLAMNRPTGKVYVDRSQIEQIIMNFAVNARDAMPSGGTLLLEASNVELETDHFGSPGVVGGPYVLLAVSDNGVGMDRATQERIFEPFFTTKAVGKGTGLGLAMVFGIVRQSNGHIHVYSEPGVGTTFKIYLPRTDRDADVPFVSPPSPSTLRGHETILLVEDNEQVRRVNLAILQRHGYQVLEAQNGGEALLICEKFTGTIDLLLTDVVMPHMNGRELAERLMPLRPSMKVVFASGYTEDSVVLQGVLDEGISFLPKPIKPEALLRKVREVLEVAPQS
jgi:two-component system cell cycle sensor histidine kinase/response regulator CckA